MTSDDVLIAFVIRCHVHARGKSRRCEKYFLAAISSGGSLLSSSSGGRGPTSSHSPIASRAVVCTNGLSLSGRRPSRQLPTTSISFAMRSRHVISRYGPLIATECH